MPRTKEQNEAIRNEKMSQIMEAALKLFSEKGFHSVSTAMIAKYVNISKGLLYHYIESKEDLLKLIIRKALQQTFDYLDNHKVSILSGEQFEAFVKEVFLKIRTQKSFYRLLYSTYLTSDIKAFVLEEMHENNYFSILYKYFEKNFEDPEKEFSIYMTMHEGSAFMYCMDAESYNIKVLDYMAEEIIKRFKR